MNLALFRLDILAVNKCNIFHPNRSNSLPMNPLRCRLPAGRAPSSGYQGALQGTVGGARRDHRLEVRSDRAERAQQSVAAARDLTRREHWQSVSPCRCCATRCSLSRPEPAVLANGLGAGRAGYCQNPDRYVLSAATRSSRDARINHRPPIQVGG